MNFNLIETANLLSSNADFIKGSCCEKISDAIVKRKQLLSSIVDGDELPSSLQDQYIPLSVAGSAFGEDDKLSSFSLISAAELRDIILEDTDEATIIEYLPSGTAEHTVSADSILDSLGDDIATMQAMNDSFMALSDNQENVEYLQQLSLLGSSSPYKDNSVYQQYIRDMEESVLSSSQTSPVLAAAGMCTHFRVHDVNESTFSYDDVVQSDVAYLSPLSYFLGSLPPIDWGAIGNAIYSVGNFVYKILSGIVNGIGLAINSFARYINNTWVDPEILVYQDGEKQTLDYPSPLYHFEINGIRSSSGGSSEHELFRSQLRHYGIHIGEVWNASRDGSRTYPVVRRIALPGVDIFFSYRETLTNPNEGLFNIEFKMFYRMKPMPINPVAVGLAGPLTDEQLVQFVTGNAGLVYQGTFQNPNGVTDYGSKALNFNAACMLAGRCAMYYLISLCTHVLGQYDTFTYWSSVMPDNPNAYSLFYRGDINVSSISAPNDIASRINFCYNNTVLNSNWWTITNNNRDYSYDMLSAISTLFSNGTTSNQYADYIFFLIYILAIKSVTTSLVTSASVANIPRGGLRLRTQSEYVNEAANFLIATALIGVSTVLLISGIKISNKLLTSSSVAATNARITSERYLEGLATKKEVLKATKKARFYSRVRTGVDNDFMLAGISLNDVKKLIK